MQKIKDFIYYNRKEIITIGIITLLFALYPIFIDKKGENEQIVLEEKQTIEQTNANSEEKMNSTVEDNQQAEKTRAQKKAFKIAREFYYDCFRIISDLIYGNNVTLGLENLSINCHASYNNCHCHIRKLIFQKYENNSI